MLSTGETAQVSIDMLRRLAAMANRYVSESGNCIPGEDLKALRDVQSYIATPAGPDEKGPENLCFPAP